MITSKFLFEIRFFQTILKLLFAYVINCFVHLIAINPKKLRKEMRSSGCVFEFDFKWNTCVYHKFIVFSNYYVNKSKGTWCNWVKFYIARGMMQIQRTSGRSRGSPNHIGDQSPKGLFLVGISRDYARLFYLSSLRLNFRCISRWWFISVSGYYNWHSALNSQSVYIQQARQFIS